MVFFEKRSLAGGGKIVNDHVRGSLDRIQPGEAIPHGAMPGKKFDEALLRRHSGVSQAQFPPSDFFKKKIYIKKFPVLTYVCRKTCPELTYEGQIFLMPIQTGTAFVGKLSQLYLYLFAAVLN